jgi:hypothetical protein
MPEAVARDRSERCSAVQRQRTSRKLPVCLIARSRGVASPGSAREADCSAPLRQQAGRPRSQSLSQIFSAPGRIRTCGLRSRRFPVNDLDGGNTGGSEVRGGTTEDRAAAIGQIVRRSGPAGGRYQSDRGPVPDPSLLAPETGPDAVGYPVSVCRFGGHRDRDSTRRGVRNRRTDRGPVLYRPREQPARPKALVALAIGADPVRKSPLPVVQLSPVAPPARQVSAPG